MNIDFHVHGLISKRKEFNAEFLLSEIRFAKELGIDALVLCEHYNAIEYYNIYNFLRDNYIYEGDRYIVDGVSIFPAMEVSVKGRGHVIIISGRDNIIEIRKRLEYYMDKNEPIDFEALLDMVDLYNAIKIGAHPCRRGHRLCKQEEGLLKRLDAIDLNGKDIYRKGKKLASEELRDLSDRIDVNIITGSDSHTPLQLGGIYTTLNRECTTIEELRRCIREKDYSINIYPSLEFRIYSSKILKRYLVRLENYNKDFNFRI